MKALVSPLAMLLKSVSDTAILAPVMRCVSLMNESARPIRRRLEGRSHSLVLHTLSWLSSERYRAESRTPRQPASPLAP